MFALNRVLTRRPWSLKKRLLVTTVLSATILMSAIMAGSSVYWFGRLTGLFRAQSLVDAVTTEVMQDPRLVDRFYHALDEQVCHNNELQYDLTLTPPLHLTPATGRNQCSELVLIGPMGNPTYIKIQGYPRPAAMTLANHLVGLTKVQTESFNHPLYPATSVRAYRGSVPIMYIILAPDTYSSWSFIYYPADPVGERILEKLAKSFQLHDN